MHIINVIHVTMMDTYFIDNDHHVTHLFFIITCAIGNAPTAVMVL